MVPRYQEASFQTRRKYMEYLNAYILVPLYFLEFTGIYIKISSGLKMDGSSSVSSDSYLNATSDRFPLPSAWPRGYNYRLSFLWLSKNVDFQSRIPAMTKQ